MTTIPQIGARRYVRDHPYGSAIPSAEPTRRVAEHDRAIDRAGRRRAPAARHTIVE
jgi:hypothetical protein